MKQDPSNTLQVVPSLGPRYGKTRFKRSSYYLIKLYTYNRESLFGDIEDARLELNSLGKVAADEWLRSAQTYPELSIDEWLVLPNRLEGIVNIDEPTITRQYNRNSHKPRQLSFFVASYKAAAAKRINLVRNAPGSAIWQRSYQERFIPDNAVLTRVRQMLHRHPAL
ncbi:hypothetical protein PN498_07175 [Oscillatoria sp. CS-180]|uniref:hypothetical protein n=1 Tax=Oscillatoria sp. CS-180 TaxID=3021720 RepID=UPI00232F5D20|nr:hypothetical protein [Oscillatoria sp. CS-180]MDB9525764.1 hypothetical protein [Oscillatoria sp. CS-180]